MSGEYRATDKDWKAQDYWFTEGDTDARCLLELRSRVEVLERRCEVQLQQLGDLQGCHHRLAGSVRLLEREVVVDRPEPATATEESSAAAPAGSLVEQMLDAMDQHLESNRYAEARAALRVVADWFRIERDSPETAAALEQEADR